MHGYFPCGACGQYVSIEDNGCEHYRLVLRFPDPKERRRERDKRYAQQRRDRQQASLTSTPDLA